MATNRLRGATAIDAGSNEAADEISAACGLIGGREPPTWLAGFLSKQAARIALYVYADDNAPSREDHLLRMGDIQKHAEALARLLDTRTMDYLQGVKARSDTMASLPIALCDLLIRIAVNTEAVRAQQQKGNVGRLIPIRDGKPLKILEGTVFAAGVCIGAWTAVHGLAPGQTNAKAQEAAAAIWRAAGGKGCKDWRPIMRQAKTDFRWLVEDAIDATTVARLGVGVHEKGEKI